MKNINFRTLRADEIEVRPSHVKDGKANLLLYIDSRAVVALLNETVGNMNWQSKFYEVNGRVIGAIGIYDEDRRMWVWKSDTGSESNIEAEKGLISDTYKRVLSRWGVQELYTAPKIQVSDDGYGNSGYKVGEVRYNEQREITHLTIVNRFGEEIFDWDKDKTAPQKPTPQTVNTNSVNTIVDDGRKAVIQFIKDSANKEYKKEGTNQKELRKFVDYYVGKVEKDGWKGDFYFDKLFLRWMSHQWTN